MAFDLPTCRQHFLLHANPANAPAMEKYMRHQFKFLGIKQPQRKALLKALIQAQGLPQPSELAAALGQLWDWPEREFQYVGCDLLERSTLSPDLWPTLERLITTRAWWDTVDPLAIHTVGRLNRQYPSEAENYLQRWQASENLWLRRTTILFQLSYKTDTNTDLLLKIIRENSQSTEFFIKKAMGWALREYSKTDAIVVTQWVETYDLPALTRREAMKWLNTHSRK
ncbi:MAG: DNA alkylation repair protein [Cyanobacteria bacterium J06632_22]